MHYYFRQSDQVPTALFVYTDLQNSLAVDNPTYMAGALLLQRTPIDHSRGRDVVEKEEDDWFTDISLLATITGGELMSTDISSETLLYRLFHERGVCLSAPKAIQAHCHCSQQRIEKMLANFSHADLEEILVDGKIDVVCEFCSESYSFSESALNEIRKNNES